MAMGIAESIALFALVTAILILSNENVMLSAETAKKLAETITATSPAL